MEINDARAFLFDRLIEAFHKDTIDSHRVRCHNALTLLEESVEVISGWANNNVKIFETVKLCVEETIDAIDLDTCLQYNCCSKQILINSLRDYAKKDDPVLANQLLYILAEVIRENVSAYLHNLFDAISSIVLSDSLEREEMAVLIDLDRLITSFATQLIHEGYSKIYLYKFFSRVKEDSKHSYHAKIRYIKNILCSGVGLKTTTIIKVPISNVSKWICPILHLEEAIPEGLLAKEIMDANVGFVTPSISSRYYIHSSNFVKDSVSALKETREQLSREMDIIHLGDSSISINIPNTALVVTTNRNGSFHSEMTTEYILDGGYSASFDDVTKLIENVNKIQRNLHVSDDLKERLDSALRHLRIGNIQDELEQRFINYWIALEFIFASPEARESTFTRLKTNLMNLLSSCYIKRNIVDLNKRLIKGGEIKKDQQIWTYGEKELNDLISKEENCLMRYRIRKTKALILDKNKRKGLFSIHESNLNYHLARLYRLRNELIHEAAIKQDIESITSNLRYYLVFLLNQIIRFCSSNSDEEERDITLSDFFCYYELYKKRISEDYDLGIIMNVPYGKSLI